MEETACLDIGGLSHMYMNTGKEKKESNCGFIKVEVKEKRCVMEVHLRCPGLTPKAECRIYGFIRNAGLMDSYLLGICKTGEGSAECVLETDAMDMGGSGISLGRMGGIILKTESGAFLELSGMISPYGLRISGRSGKRPKSR